MQAAAEDSPEKAMSLLEKLIAESRTQEAKATIMNVLTWRRHRLQKRREKYANQLKEIKDGKEKGRYEWPPESEARLQAKIDTYDTRDKEYSDLANRKWEYEEATKRLLVKIKQFEAECAYARPSKLHRLLDAVTLAVRGAVLAGVSLLILSTYVNAILDLFRSSHATWSPMSRLVAAEAQFAIAAPIMGIAFFKYTQHEPWVALTFKAVCRFLSMPLAKATERRSRSISHCNPPPPRLLHSLFFWSTGYCMIFFRPRLQLIFQLWQSGRNYLGPWVQKKRISTLTRLQKTSEHTRMLTSS